MVYNTSRYGWSVQNMIDVTEAERIVLRQVKSYGIEKVPIDHALGRILAESIIADRDLPPYNRVTMDGIGLLYSSFMKGCRTFNIKGIQAAGDKQIDIINPNECIRIMTGASLPETIDTIVRQEDITIDKNTAFINLDKLSKGQYIHSRGVDKKKGEVLVTKGQIITPSIIATLSSVGKSSVAVSKVPKIVVITTGDELVNIDEKPSGTQIRKSNNYAIRAVLEQFKVQTDFLHIPDSPQKIKIKLKECLKFYDVIIISGGVSKGVFDYIPSVLNQLKVKQLFHGIKQKPGKPFWFGATQKKLVFAFPGNPVSTYLCLYRYFLPWLRKSTGEGAKKDIYAVLKHEVKTDGELTYFIPVNLNVDRKANLNGIPIPNNGSGDFSSLIYADGFMELPNGKNVFKKGVIYRIWEFRTTL